MTYRDDSAVLLIGSDADNNEFLSLGSSEVIIAVCLHIVLLLWAVLTVWCILYPAVDDISCEFFPEKILKNYSELKGDLHLVELEREAGTSLGLSLVGNRDLTAMSVFVAGIQPDSIAAFSGLIHVGDELLEVKLTTLTLLRFSVDRSDFCILFCSLSDYFGYLLRSGF